VNVPLCLGFPDIVLFVELKDNPSGNEVIPIIVCLLFKPLRSAFIAVPTDPEYVAALIVGRASAALYSP
jgi:hypothetical protein